MSAAATQKKLVLDDAPALVLSTISDARRELVGHDEDDIIAMIEDGALPLAWNIAVDPKNAAREFRIHPDCLTHYKTTGGSRPYRSTLKYGRPNFGLLGHHAAKPFLSSNTLKLLLNCGSTHVINLVESRQLALLAGTDYGRGPNGAALVDRKSFERFLETRLEGAL